MKNEVLQVLDEVIEGINDYSEDSYPNSEYRQACADLVEMVQVIKERFKPYD